MIRTLLEKRDAVKLKLDESSDQDYHLMLIANYESEQQYNNRKEHFQEIIQQL